MSKSVDELSEEYAEKIFDEVESLHITKYCNIDFLEGAFLAGYQSASEDKDKRIGELEREIELHKNDGKSDATVIIGAFKMLKSRQSKMDELTTQNEMLKKKLGIAVEGFNKINLGYHDSRTRTADLLTIMDEIQDVVKLCLSKIGGMDE